MINRSRVQWSGLLGGPLLAVLVYLTLPDSYTGTAGQTVLLSHAGRATAATGVCMAVWWLSEALPVYATALLPLALFPITGATSIHEAAAPYGHELIYLFMGGFILALSMEKWGLHRRIAFSALSFVGTAPGLIVAVFMFITALMSMWVTNTATTIMMLPIALSVIALMRGDRQEDGPGVHERSNFAGGHNFALCLLLGIAYAASIGGIGTIIGTAPNLFVVSFIKNQLGIEISFVSWMAIGVPVTLTFLPLTWLALTRFVYPLSIGKIEGGEILIREARSNLGPMQRGEWWTLAVFLLAATLWIFRPLLAAIHLGDWQPFSGLTDPGIAITAALLLFVIPVNVANREFVMDWDTAVRLPWGLLVLFGGGLSLAAAIDNNGVSQFLGSLAGHVAGMPSLLVVLIIVALIIFLTELTSNTATTATLIPILAAVAPGLGLDPLVLIVPAAIAASCAFMLPVATPPNAIVFGSGLVRIPEMSRAGIWLNVLGIGLITGLMYLVAMPFLGVKVAVLTGGG